jgi:hypothetical protein
MKWNPPRSTWEDVGGPNGRPDGDCMYPHDDDIPQDLDPRLREVDRLLAVEAARLMGRAPAGLAARVAAASAAWLPRREVVRGVEWSIAGRKESQTTVTRRLALAACMALVFIAGMWAIRPEPAPLVATDPQIVPIGGSEGLSAFLTPIGDDEMADDRAGVSVLELGDAEFWAVEAELAALESILRVR